MQYIATTRNSRYFEIVNERQEFAGSLDYNIWLTSQAEIRTADSNLYDIVPAGFWQIKKAITKNGMDFAELKANMGNGIIISFANGQSLLFKRKNQWSSGDYVLMDDAGNKTAVMQANFKWQTLTFDYSMEIFANVQDRETGMVLPMILVYCAKFIRMRGAG